jgi:hypothetical protein
MKLIQLIAFLLATKGVCLSQELPVSQLNFKTFYIGINNPISIVSNSVCCENIFVITDNGEVIKTGKCRYSAKPKKTGKVQIRVYSIDLKDTLLIDTINFKAKKLPEPKLKLYPSLTHFNMHHEKLDSISVYIENSEIELIIQIASFDIVLKHKDQTIDSIHYEGASVDKRYLDLYRKGKKEDKIWFRNVEIILENKRFFAPINSFYIKL